MIYKPECSVMVALGSLDFKRHPLDLDGETELTFSPARQTVIFCFKSKQLDNLSLRANLIAHLGNTGDASFLSLYFTGDSERT